LSSLRLSIDDMLSRREVAFEGEHRAVLEAYRMFANDQGWVRRLKEAIGNGLTAEAAVEKVQSDMRARMLHMTDPYLRERMTISTTSRTGCCASCWGAALPMARLPKDAIVVARTMGRRNCSTIRATGCAAWCWKMARPPAMSSLSRAQWASGRRPAQGRGLNVGQWRCHHRRRR
jgi:signal transduction protein with GAF and PtsI domain